MLKLRIPQRIVTARIHQSQPLTRNLTDLHGIIDDTYQELGQDPVAEPARKALHAMFKAVGEILKNLAAIKKQWLIFVQHEKLLLKHNSELDLEAMTNIVDQQIDEAVSSR